MYESSVKARTSRILNWEQDPVYTKLKMYNYGFECSCIQPSAWGIIVVVQQGADQYTINTSGCVLYGYIVKPYTIC